MFRALLSIATLALLFVPNAAAQGASVEDLVKSGTTYLTNGNCQLAQVAFQSALKTEPRNADALLGKGRALVCQGAVELGIEEFSRVLEVNPNSVLARVHMALAYTDQFQSDPVRFGDRLGRSLDLLRAAERIDSQSVQVYNTKGLVLYHSSQYGDAEEAFRRAIQLANSSGSVNQASLAAMNVNLGNSLRELGRLPESRTVFKRAVMLDPTNSGARNRLGDVHFKLGDCEDAVFELSQAVSLNPSSLDAMANLAISTFECGSVAESVPHFQRAIESGAGLVLPPLYTYLARAYLQQGRTREAVLEAQKGALLPPVTPEAFYWLGQAYQARGEGGDSTSARGAYERALELNQDFAPAQEALRALQ